MLCERLTSVLTAAWLQALSFHAACIHIVFIEYAFRDAVRRAVQITMISGDMPGLDAFGFVVRVNFAANHLARVQADGSDYTSANIRALPALVATQKLKADGEIAEVHEGIVCEVLPSKFTDAKRPEE